MIQASTNRPGVLEADAVVIGAGFAGAATAFHLMRRGLERVVVLEKERFAGVHSSGRNAAMIRQVTRDPAVAELARRGGAAIRGIARARGDDLFRGHGSLLLASGEEAQELREDACAAREAGLETAMEEPRRARRRVGVLETATFDLACWCPSDGVVDVASLLDHYLRGVSARGGRVVFGEAVTEILRDGSRVRGVRTSQHEIHANHVVNAAGGWAGRIGELAGSSVSLLRPTRRHLFVTPAMESVSHDWPFVWETSRDVYFRPETGGLLVSACDITDAGSSLDDNRVRDGILEILQEKLASRFPSLSEIAIKRGWSGIRTLTPDGRFVIGPDPELESFHWVAGLGGHGVTTSWSVGDLAARLVLGEEDRAFGEAAPYDPGRFGPAAEERLREGANAQSAG